MNTDLNSLARTNWFAIIAEGDGAESIICCESELKQKLHAIYCVCGHDWDKCETEDIIQTIRTLDSDDSWTHDFLPNGRHIWRDRGEDYTVTVATLNGIPAVIREAIEKTLESTELRKLLNAAKELDKVQTLLGAATVLDDEIMDVIEAYRAIRSLKQSRVSEIRTGRK